MTVAAVESWWCCDCLILLGRQYIVHCCHRTCLCLGRCTLSHTIFVIFAPRWAAALLAAFLLRRTQSTTHPCHHCTPPPLCRSRRHLFRHQTTAAVLLLFVVFVATSPPLLMAGCCVLGGWNWTSLTLSSTFSFHRLLILLLPSPASPPPFVDCYFTARGLTTTNGIVAVRHSSQSLFR